LNKPEGSLDLAGPKSKMIVDSVVSRGPIDLNIGAAELSQLVHMQLDSDAKVIVERIADAHGAVGPLQAASARLHGQVIVMGAEQEALCGKAVDLNTRQVLCEQAASVEPDKKEQRHSSSHKASSPYVSAVVCCSFNSPGNAKIRE
jgi:hypothetical protein